MDDKIIIDNWTVQRRGEEFFGCASKEERGTVHIPANHSPSIYVEFCNVRGPAPADGDEDEAVMDANAGMRLGGAEVQDADERMESAVKLAKEADVVVAVVGLNADWETEGYDRKTLGLPGRTDELVRKVVEANPKTVVVTQSVCFPIPSSDLLGLVADRHTVHIGILNYYALGDFCAGCRACVVWRQCDWRGDRGCVVREGQPFGEAFLDVPEEGRGSSFVWTFPLRRRKGMRSFLVPGWRP